MKHSQPLIMDAMIRLTEQVDLLQRQVNAAKQILEDETAESLKRHTGIPLDRCRELLSILMDKPK
jgi:hypothetical protein